MIKEAISKVIDQKDLTEGEATGVMNEIMGGEATPAQIACFLTALRLKGETVEEITGSARVMREKVTPVKTRQEMLVDTCGTGGDGLHTFNISTTAAFVVAGAGLAVAKHGNRSVSSRCGSADLLKAFGVNIEAGVEKVEECLEKVGIGFLFAPLLHGAMKYAIGPRREIGIRTIFNILGPLTNPAGAQAQVLGVYAGQLTETLAGVLKNLGSRHAFVVHGMDGLDEITLTAETKVSELVGGEVRNYHIKPEEFGLKRCRMEDLKGGDTGENVEITRGVLEGQAGHRREIVLLNASAAIVAGGKARDLSEGVEKAAQSIDSGKALEKLEKLIQLTSAQETRK
ncbi:anthranilate phosphoribosyltransferase [candidate division NPL-UPA2 bacterium]|nr:anthranilate phosphoribosyltransferase [candidate division NPL-UPA2 bacterium]